MKLLQLTGYYFWGFSFLLLLMGGAGLYWGLGKLFDHEMDELLLGSREPLLEELNRLDSLEPRMMLLDNVVLLNPVSNVTDHITLADTMLWIQEEDEQELEPYRLIAFDSELGGRPYRIAFMESKYENELLLSSITALIVAMLVLLFLLLNGINHFLASRIWRPFTHALGQMSAFRVGQSQSLAFLPTKIDEFQQLEAALEEMTTKMQKDYRALKQFSENASHEIQTPLAIIRSQVELLMQQGNLGEEQARHLSQIREAADRLSRLNQALLLLTRIENQQYETRNPVNLREVIERKLSSFELLAEAKAIQISASLTDVSAVIHPDLADVLVSNLLGNAIRHNVNGGTVAIELAPRQLVIRNTGNALEVAPELLFQRFQKGNDASRSNGLGLAIVREICHQAGWRASYEIEDAAHVVSVCFHP